MKTTIGVFFGGRSVEHEISVISALQAIAALDAARYDVVPVYITKQGRWFTGPALSDTAAYRDMEALERRSTEVYMAPEYGSRLLYRKRSGLFGGGRKVMARLDIALPVLHGTNGEDGTFQGFLELTGIPYVGCGVLASAVGMDKITMKMVLRESGLPVIDYVWFTDRRWSGDGRDGLVARIESEIGYPVIVKPANLGSSVGISPAASREELMEAVETAAGYSSRILVEKMIEPLREINCSVLGSAGDVRTSVCEEPLRRAGGGTDGERAGGGILSYADKYMSGGSDAAGGNGGSDGGVKGFAGGAKGFVSGVKGNPGNFAVGTKGLSAGVNNLAAGTKGSEVMSGGMSSTKRRIPADLPEPAADEIRRLAAETFRVLGCEGVARVDFILDGGSGRSESESGENRAKGSDSAASAGDGGAVARGGLGADVGKIYVNEINTIPGSLSFYLWEATGVSFSHLMDLLVGQALGRERAREHKIVSYKENIFSMGSFGGGTGGVKGVAKTGGKGGGGKFGENM